MSNGWQIIPMAGRDLASFRDANDDTTYRLCLFAKPIDPSWLEGKLGDPFAADSPDDASE